MLIPSFSLNLESIESSLKRALVPKILYCEGSGGNKRIPALDFTRLIARLLFPPLKLLNILELSTP